ncbi:hypothetical protein ACS7SF_13995 [Ralstonia sp. 25C]
MRLVRLLIVASTPSAGVATNALATPRTSIQQSPDAKPVAMDDLRYVLPR